MEQIIDVHFHFREFFTQAPSCSRKRYYVLAYRVIHSNSNSIHYPQTLQHTLEPVSNRPPGIGKRLLQVLSRPLRSDRRSVDKRRPDGTNTPLRRVRSKVLGEIVPIIFIIP